MKIIRTWDALAQALVSPLDPVAQQILEVHRDRLAEFEDNDLCELASFCIIQAGDQPSAVEEVSGIAIFDDPPEYIDPHNGWWECCWIVSDGFGWVVLIPDALGTDPALLQLCRSHTAAA